MASDKARARQMYRDGMLLIDIAKVFNKSPGTIRSWKSRDIIDWETGKKKERNVAEDLQRNATRQARKKMIASVEENTELTNGEKEFCLHYSERPNATRAYKKAFPDVTYGSASTLGLRLLGKVKIRNEIERLKEIKRESFVADPMDLFYLMWEAAFAGMGEFIEWGQYENASTGAVYNDVRFRNSTEVDDTLISEVKQGREGISIKLISREKAIDWLTMFFEMNPMDKHKKEFDNRRLLIEEKKTDDLPVEPVVIHLKRD